MHAVCQRGAWRKMRSWGMLFLRFKAGRNSHKACDISVLLGFEFAIQGAVGVSAGLLPFHGDAESVPSWENETGSVIQFGAGCDVNSQVVGFR
jgi:hypothetical protein